MTDPPPFAEPPTRAEIDAAQRLGVGVDIYRRFKRNAGPAGERLETGDGPADIVAEQQLADRMRREPGLFKGRNEPPGIFMEAARAPGEVAQKLLSIFCYLVMMFLIIGLGGQKVQRVPGIFQVIGLLLLVIPAMMLAGFIWERVGEGVRDVVRGLVRFWPATLLLLFFAFGLIKFLLG